MSTVAPGEQNEMKVQLRYEGPALAAGRMNAADLGPAMIAVAKLFERTGTLVYGDGRRLRIDVTADFERGSFEIEFIAVATSADLLPPFSLEDFANIAAVLGFIGSGTWGLIKLVRWQRGRKIDRAERQGCRVFG